MYGRQCKSVVGWYEVGEMSLIGLDFVFHAMGKVRITRKRLKAAQSYLKLYLDVRKRYLEFEKGDGSI